MLPQAFAGLSVERADQTDGITVDQHQLTGDGLLHREERAIHPTGDAADGRPVLQLNHQIGSIADPGLDLTDPRLRGIEIGGPPA